MEKMYSWYRGFTVLIIQTDDTTYMTKGDDVLQPECALFV